MKCFESYLKKIKDIKYNESMRICIDSNKRIVFNEMYDDGILLVPFLLEMFKKCGYYSYYDCTALVVEKKR